MNSITFIAFGVLCVQFTMGKLMPDFCDFGDCGDQLLVQRCYYEQAWRDFNSGQSNSICHDISSPPSRHDNNRELKRKRMWRIIAETDVKDRELAVDCFRYHQTDQAEQCAGLTHGDLHENKPGLLNRDAVLLVYYRTAKQQWDIAENCFYKRDWLTKPDHPCRVVANKSDSESVFMRKQREWAFGQLIKRDGEDRELVSHCFYYHQNDEYAQCNGVTHHHEQAKDIFHSELRANRIASLMEDLYKSMVTEETDSDLKSVLACFYNNTWIFVPNSPCFAIVLTMHPTEHDIKLHHMYEEVQMKALVADCFYNHRSDEYISCYMISWNNGDGANLPANEKHKKYWNRLAAAQKCATDEGC